MTWPPRISRSSTSARLMRAPLYADVMKRVCVLQHVPYEGQGYIADYFLEHRIDFDVVRLWEPYVLPSGVRLRECVRHHVPSGALAGHGPGTGRRQSFV